MWAKQIGFPEDVINYSLSERISVYSLNVVPETTTIDAYAKFLKEAGILKADDNPKVDARFAQKALAEVKK
jgi:sulfonate transport system substrate-binding protein